MKRYVAIIVTAVVIAYLAVALTLTSYMAANDTCSEVCIQVNDTSSHPFVTVRELNRDLDDIINRAPGRPLSELNTAEIEQRLSRIDKIEDARAIMLTTGKVLIEVTPMRPVARVFDGNRSYYINKDGKRISADARYHMDVPVIIGRLDQMNLKAESYLPLVKYISSDPGWDALVSAIRVESPRDIMLVPVIHGHVINLGDTSGYKEKLERLRLFYREVMPEKGWSYYDTISVKWRGQVVATRAVKGSHAIPDIEEDIDETDDATTMLPTDDALDGKGFAPEGRPHAPQKPDTVGSKKSETKSETKIP